MDGSTNDIKIDVDETNRNRYVYGAFKDSGSVYEAESTEDETTMYLNLREPAAINTVSFKTNAESATLFVVVGTEIIEKRVSHHLQ